MNILITGANGQLGRAFIKNVNDSIHNVYSYDSKQLNVTNKNNIEEIFNNVKPDVVLHCAAYTAVDKAEDEKEICYNINVKGTEYVAYECAKYNTLMVYFSTDYVFDGKGSTPFTEEDIPNPLSIYGKSKYEGEKIVSNILQKYFIIRTAWLYGDGNNFVKTMLRLSETHKNINVVNDQIGSPTFTEDLVPVTMDLLKTDKYGIYHITNNGFCSWYDFVLEIFKNKNISLDVNSIPSSEYNTKAKRPLNSRLSKDKLYSILNRTCMPSWQNAISRYLKTI